jgi:perosamine synthetase
MSADSHSIALARPCFDEREERAVVDVLRSGWVTQGPRVAQFEQRLAERVGAREAIATSSCTTALFLSLRALDIGPGDEVVVPSLSFIASANAILHCGAEPVFV